MPDVAGRLAEVAALRGFPTGEPLARLLAYLEAMVETNRVVNLTAATTLEEAAETVAVSALAVVRAWARPEPPRRAIDLGSGNGFPGVAVATAWPGCRVLLVERRAKKARAIRDCLARAGIGNAEAVPLDGRELVRDRPEVAGAADLVTVRAAGTLAETTAIAGPWVAPGGRVVHWKGENLSDDERRRGRAAAEAAGLDDQGEIDFGAPPPGPARLVVYERPPSGRRRGG
jgi:16S rRNA (guanine527-N7)-methyltransferase